jgi:hypothetical protein
VQLKHTSIPHLIAEAGGDPWAINKSLQNGRPAQISDLAQAFHNAGQSTNAAPVSDLPDGFIVYDKDHPHGRIATPEDLQGRGITVGQYDNAIGSALSRVLAPRPTDEQMSPDQYVSDRYDDVIGVPHAEPPK